MMCPVVIRPSFDRLSGRLDNPQACSFACKPLMIFGKQNSSRASMSCHCVWSYNVNYTRGVRILTMILSLEPDQKTARIFFALWPNAVVRRALDEAGKHLHERCGGRRMRAETLHLTLAFLGEVAQERLEELQRLACLCDATAFDLELTHAGYWAHNHIAWVAPAAAPQALIELVGGLEMRLAAAGFAFDARSFVPHVTLLRNAQCPQNLSAMVAPLWSVRDFVLVKSTKLDSLASYQCIGRWPLSGA